MPTRRTIPFDSAHLLALSVLVGIVVPPLAAALRPLLFPSIFCLILFAVLLIDLRGAFAGMRRDAAPAFAVCAWQLLALPLAFGVVHLYSPLGGEYSLLAFYTACAGSLFGAAAFARLMNLDEAMALRGTLASVLLMPLTLPPLSAWVAGAPATFDVAGYAWRLGVFLALPLITALFVQSRARWRARVQGCAALRHGSVLFLCVFAIGVMDGIGPRILAEPAAMAGLLLLALAIHAGQFVLTALVFAAGGRGFALTAGLLASYRNLGLLLAVAGALLPEGFIVFVAVWQVPMYLTPLIVSRLSRNGKR